jgi:hypothetical protein
MFIDQILWDSLMGEELSTMFIECQKSLKPPVITYKEVEGCS